MTTLFIIRITLLPYGAVFYKYVLFDYRFNILEFKKKVYIWETEGGFYMEIRGGNSFVSFKCLDALWMMYVEFA